MTAENINEKFTDLQKETKRTLLILYFGGHSILVDGNMNMVLSETGKVKVLETKEHDGTITKKIIKEIPEELKESEEVKVKEVDMSVIYPLQKTILSLINDKENLFVWNLNDTRQQYLDESSIKENYFTDYEVPEELKESHYSVPPKGTCLMTNGFDSEYKSTDAV